MSAGRWINRPDGSNWGEFGPDDERGRLNLLTSERTRQAAQEIQEGRSFCLSLPLDYPGGSFLNPRRGPPRHFATIRDDSANFNYDIAREDPAITDVICDDAVLLHMQYSTQWDSLCHVGARFDADGDGDAEIVYYNGWRGGEHITTGDGHVGCGMGPEGVQAQRLGIERMAETGVQGRGVMVDLLRHFGSGRTLVTGAMFREVLERDEIAVEAGDMLCLHTGFAEALLGMNRTPDAEKLARSFAVLDGQDEDLRDWITESGIAVLIADNYAVEQTKRTPVGPQGSSLPLHEHCLFKLGIHLGELWRLGPLNEWLRARGRSRFFLTAPPLRLPGAVGSPVTPVATV
ncbi:hypothetical protein DSM110093_03760 (plasmid) [Sulfitobacter sp. DSM 110093]|uniref:cyclase family protein n=1 Tax=Sulfitobacter sp. DSM 110093 TaxID=2883127 RepID=UPI001FABAA69|nr:cyclase family protein [Sulfitobacter sp. DSM 110093]UOA33664.1 hypothetical protein DSM110093_03499 [Sulfitobacter sp. DSM 110093]UOA33925.1 hypothetical protein DSM110093_03760 [Sulfitobacter sp. DSM 110093]